jgi:hypothetical protein
MTMAVTAPDWLTQRGVSLQESKDGHSWVVYLDREPQYLLMAVPAGGKHSCRITQTINGHRLDGPGAPTYATIAEALQGGLETLAKTLGWR